MSRANVGFRNMCQKRYIYTQWDVYIPKEPSKRDLRRAIKRHICQEKKESSVVGCFGVCLSLLEISFVLIHTHESRLVYSLSLRHMYTKRDSCVCIKTKEISKRDIHTPTSQDSLSLSLSCSNTCQKRYIYTQWDVYIPKEPSKRDPLSCSFVTHEFYTCVVPKEIHSRKGPFRRLFSFLFWCIHTRLFRCMCASFFTCLVPQEKKKFIREMYCFVVSSGGLFWSIHTRLIWCIFVFLFTCVGPRPKEVFFGDLLWYIHFDFKYIYICIYTYLYLHIYTYIYMDIWIYAYMHMHIYICICIFIYICTW